ncbi:hypothetical protein D3C79_1044360 [compost metagenome]
MISAAERRLSAVMFERNAVDLLQPGIAQPHRRAVRAQVEFYPCCNIGVLLHLEHHFIVAQCSGQLSLKSWRIRLITS